MRILFDARRSVCRATGIGRVVDGLLSGLTEKDRQNRYLVLYGENNPIQGIEAPDFEARQLDLGICSPARSASGMLISLARRNGLAPLYWRVLCARLQEFVHYPH